MRNLGTVVAIIFLGFAGVANAEGTFQIGPQFGYLNTDISASAYGNASDFDVESGTLGFIARYNLPVGRDGTFVGIQAGVAKAFGSSRESISGTVIDGSNTLSGEITSKSAIEWSADIMPHIGYNFGKLSVSLAAGVSFIQGKSELLGAGTLNNAPISISLEDSQWHTGWKIAPSIAYKLTENMNFFSQVYYAGYNSKSYSDAGITAKASPKVYGATIGVLFDF